MPLPTSMKPVCVFGTNLRFLVRRKLFLLNFFQTFWHLKLLKNNHILFSSLGGKLDKFFQTSKKQLSKNFIPKNCKRKLYYLFDEGRGCENFWRYENILDFIEGMGGDKNLFLNGGGYKN